MSFVPYNHYFVGTPLLSLQLIFLSCSRLGAFFPPALLNNQQDKKWEIDDPV